MEELIKLEKYMKDVLINPKTIYDYRAGSSIEVLLNVDSMIKIYSTEKPIEKGGILLNVFGVLQALFVGIDALYDLVIGLTKHKYIININQNPVLNELKYIRNDIVGHPTNRTYAQGGIGFSILDSESITKDTLRYKTYVYNNSKKEILNKEIKFEELFLAYEKEKRIVLNELIQYLEHKSSNDQISKRILDFYWAWKSNKEHLEETLDNIKNDILKKYKVNSNSNHRFLWRLRLVKVLLNWKENDSDLVDFLNYTTETQILKLYGISLEIENKAGEKIYVALSRSVKSFYNFIASNEKDALPCLTYLHDEKHPLFYEEISELLELKPGKISAKILNWLSNLKDEDKVYLVGSVLKQYRKKKK